MIKANQHLGESIGYSTEAVDDALDGDEQGWFDNTARATKALRDMKHVLAEHAEECP